MVGTLCWEDVSDLPIFKCKLCKYRLQYPVIEVQTFGYICGSCYERSAYTNVSESTDIDKILSKLCIPCRYSERGCYFDGSFRKISEHEKRCKYGDKLCPFSLINECNSKEIRDLIDHIKKEHVDCFIAATIEENYITINENLETCREMNPETFYLFEYENKQFLFQIKIVAKKQIYKFFLYYLDDVDSDITFSFLAEHENLAVKSKSIQAMYYTEILNINHDNVLALNAMTLTNLGCDKKLKFSLNSKETTNSTILEWYSCFRCEIELIDEAHVCSHCSDVQICTKCYKQDRHCRLCGHGFSKPFSMCKVNPSSNIKCTQIGCNQYIRKDQYDIHRKKCRFKLYECPLSSTKTQCKWTGFYTDVAIHALQEHTNLTSINYTSKLVPPRDSKTHYFLIIKNSTTIKVKYKFTSNGRLSLKLGAIGPMSSDDFMRWELHLYGKTLKSTVESIICGAFDDTDNNFDDSIDVSNYIIDDKLQFSIYITY